MKRYACFMFLLGIFCVRFVAGGGSADNAGPGEFDWPHRRGQTAAGISFETDWDPTALNRDSAILWHQKVGIGFCSVVTKGDRVFTIGNKRREDTVFCFDAETGDEIWRFSYPCNAGSGGYGALATATIADNHLYTLSNAGVVHCINSNNGKRIWKKNIVDDFGAEAPDNGFAGSPVVAEDLLLLTARCSGLALERRTGRKVWMSEPLRRSESFDRSYTFPAVYHQDGNALALNFFDTELYCMDAATGEQIWTFPWHNYGTDPFVFDGKLLLSSGQVREGTGQGDSCVLLDIREDGPVEIWRRNIQSDVLSGYICTPIRVGQLLFGGNGDMTSNVTDLQCVDLNTGELMWEHQLPGSSVCLIAANNMLIILDGTGTIHIAEAVASGYTEISNYELPGPKGLWWNTPVLSAGRLYARCVSGDLVCIDLRKHDV